MEQKAENGCGGCSDTSCSSRDKHEGESAEQCRQRKQLEERLSGIRNKILVMSGKGGVGKSSTAVNLALALAHEGKKVGLLDVDLHGPSLPKMLGVEKERPLATEEALLPVECHGLRVMSIGFLVENSSDALIWRGPMKAGVIQQFARDVEWGPLDYLVVDCPPGTGDEPLSVAQTLGEGTVAMIVTTPQQVALIDVEKSITFCHQLKLPVVGVVENMSGFVCPDCGKVVEIFKSGGGEAMASQMGVPFLGRIPIDPSVVEAGDAGRPFLLDHSDSVAGEAFLAIVRKAIEYCEPEGENEA